MTNNNKKPSQPFAPKRTGARRLSVRRSQLLRQPRRANGIDAVRSFVRSSITFVFDSSFVCRQCEKYVPVLMPALLQVRSFSTVLSANV